MFTAAHHEGDIDAMPDILGRGWIHSDNLFFNSLPKMCLSNVELPPKSAKLIELLVVAGEIDDFNQVGDKLFKFEGILDFFWNFHSVENFGDFDDLIGCFGILRPIYNLVEPSFSKFLRDEPTLFFYFPEIFIELHLFLPGEEVIIGLIFK